MTQGTCSECGSDELWAWYDQPERQTISVEVDEKGVVTYDYTGTTESSYDAGDDNEYYCGNCMRLTPTIEEMVGAPPAPPKTGVRLKIETGITGNDQESSFMNATLQKAGDRFEFSIATFISISPSVKTEEELAALISNVLSPIVAVDPRISFEVQLGLAGDGEPDSDDQPLQWKATDDQEYREEERQELERTSIDE